MLFSDYLLLESLNEVAPFYMTDDTQIPNRVTAAFKIEDTDYIFLFEKFLSEGLYKIEIIQIAGKMKRYWKFKNANHIRIAFATAIKCFEASIPFLGQNVKGIAMPIPSTLQDNYIKLCKLLINKTYLKTQFDYLPLDHTKSKFQYIMMVRKNVSPKNIFTAKYFKDYDFTNFDFTTSKTGLDPVGIKSFKSNGKHKIPAAAIDEITPVVKEKTTYTLEPSKKFEFEGHSYVLNDIENDAFDPEKKHDVINLLKKDDSDEEKKISELKKYSEDFLNSQDIKLKTTAKYGYHTPNSKDAAIKKCQTLLAIAYPDVMDYFKSDFSKFDWSYIPAFIKKIEYSYENYMWTDWISDHLYKAKYGNPTASNLAYLNSYIAEVKKAQIELANGGFTTVKTSSLNNKSTTYKIFGYEMNSNDLIEICKWAVWRFTNYVHVPYDSNMKSKSTSSVYDYNKTHGHNKISDINWKELPKMDSQASMNLSDNLETSEYSFEKAAKEVCQMNAYKLYDKSLTTAQKDSILSYTGSGFSAYNSTLRAIFNPEKSKSEGYAVSPMYFSKIKNMAAGFNKVVPIEKPFWVFRNTGVPGLIPPDTSFKAGEIISDAAFLSTSLRAGTFDGGNTRFAIYLPAGSKVIPILDKSKHPGENEIILPALSALKIIEVVLKGNRQYVKCLYLGNGMNDFIDQHLVLKEEKMLTFKEYIMENEEENKKKISSKFAPGADEFAHVDKLRLAGKLLTTNKIKLVKVPLPKK